MIAHLSGKIINLSTDSLILEVNGVGYWVSCPNYILDKCQVEQTLSIFTHQYIREDEISLYGFASLDQLKLFRNLLTITGVGPRLAMGIINRGSPDEIVKAIGSEDLTFFTAVPGVGKKNAARVILELKTKLTAQAISGLPKERVEDEVIQGLRTLGFSKKEILAVLPEIPAELPIEAKIKEILKKFSTRK